MKETKTRLPKLFKNPPKTLFDDGEDELHAYIRGPLFSRPIVYALLAIFGVSAMLAVDWFALLLLNSEGVVGSIGILNVLRVMAVFLMGTTIPSALLMLHYRRVYSYISEENVLFAITFSLSFILGLPCALVGVFG
ncbi:hypothetical protein BH24ACT22_BH24ACT22_17420 [soil metagenome]